MLWDVSLRELQYYLLRKGVRKGGRTEVVEENSLPKDMFQ
jgi:hypothetical protein